MHLKTLTIRGFKSFASPTTLRFEPGITCIVGPNGSGKSNIVDALTWVMGEQGAKSLRGSAMADVIFAGTSGKAALGRARVELTIDNSDGKLPIEYAEVTIARTLFRGGGSEYTINGAAVRLLDVQELLSDTGMGKQMHVIVGQGQLDAVLRASPQERREFIDEAAGVLKHRRRKERTLRKLAAMDADLLRVVDLNEEIRRQLRPLARQAKAARAAEGIYERVRAAQLRLHVDDLLLARAQVERDERQVSQLRESFTESEEHVRELEKALHELEAVASLYSGRLADVTEMHHQFDSLQERLHSSVVLARERISQEEGALPGVSEAAVELAAEKYADVQTASQAAELELEGARTRANRAEDERRHAEAVARDLQQQIQAAQTAAEQHRTKVARAAESEVRVQALLSSLEQSLEDVRHRLEESKNAHLEIDLADPADALRAVEQQAKKLKNAYQDADEDADRCREQLEQSQARVHELKAEFARWRARADALAQALQETGKTATKVAGAMSTFDRHLRTVKGLELPIAALLDDFEGAPVVELSAGESAEGRDTSTWPATILAAPGDEGVQAAPHPPDIPCAALDCVVTSGIVSAAAEELLGDAWLAADANQAAEILSAKKWVRRVATIDGTVFSRHTIRGRSSEAPSPLLLRSQQEAADSRAREAERSVRDAQQIASARKAELAERSEHAAQTLRELRATEQELARKGEQRNEQVKRLEAARVAVERARSDQADLEERIRQATEEVERAGAASAALKSSDERDAGDQRDALRRVEQSLLRLRQEEMQAKLAQSAAQERLRGADRQTEAFRARFEQMRVERAEGLKRDKARERRLAELREIIRRAELAREKALEHAKVTGEEKDRVSSLNSQVLQDRARISEQLERQRWEQVAVTEQRQQAEVAIAGTRLRWERAEEELDALIRNDRGEDELDEAEFHRLWEETIEKYHPNQPLFNEDGEPEPYVREVARKRLVEAERELQRLGVVNPLAVVEHEALQSRHQFLLDQVSDLRKSKRDLLDIIVEVDERIQTAFEDAFAETQRQFAEVFSSLFPGGTGKLSLTDPDNPLETGVEIYARPAGKRVTRLSLLSGGERSLAALAYLVAIFRARPSPFYVMDEVEAALDDINLSRVLQVMEELRSDSQLIMVTHQKRTMEVADALYGVSMRQGTSRVVSHKM